MRPAGTGCTGTGPRATLLGALEGEERPASGPRVPTTCERFVRDGPGAVRPPCAHADAARSRSSVGGCERDEPAGRAGAYLLRDGQPSVRAAAKWRARRDRVHRGSQPGPGNGSRSAMDTYERRGHAGHARTAGRDPNPGGPGRDHRGRAGLGASVRGDSQVLHALVRVQMTAGTDPDCFEAHLRDEVGIAEAWRLAGDCDFEVRISCRTLKDLGRHGRAVPRCGRDHLHHPRAAPRPPGRMMGIWPLTAQPAQSVGGVQLAEIAEHFGTPAYVLDEEHVRARCRENP